MLFFTTFGSVTLYLIGDVLGPVLILPGFDLTYVEIIRAGPIAPPNTRRFLERFMSQAVRVVTAIDVSIPIIVIRKS